MSTQEVVVPRLEKAAHEERLIGKALRRKEDFELLTGRAAFTADVELPKKAYSVFFVRSPVSHAIITRIDTEEARRARGVVAIFTGEDLRDVKMGYWMHYPGMLEPVRGTLAYRKVRYQGEPVVAVVAENDYLAEDAAHLVSVDYEELPALTDPVKAMDAQPIFDDLDTNVLLHDSYSSTKKVDEVLSTAPVKIDVTLYNGRTSPQTLEPRVHIAYFDGEWLTIWASTQFPHVVRTYVAECLGFPENRIRVIANHVGGGFGPKSSVFADEMALYAIALRLGVPVKWVETRTEHLLVTGHERDQIHHVRAGFTEDGILLALYDKIVADVGAGGTFWVEVQPAMVSSVSVPGPYKFEHYAFDLYAVATNKAPWSPNIGFGRPVAAFVMERVMDIAARKLGLDPAEIRRRNLVNKSDFPYRNPAGVVYDSGDYKLALEVLLDLLDYEELKKKKLGEGRERVGIGISTYSEYTAPPSTRLQVNLGWEVGGYEKAVVRVDPTGKATVYLGVLSTGQSHATVYAQIAAQEIGLKLDDVRVIEGDTNTTPYGFGSWASRSMVTAGNAVILASRKVNNKIRRVAAHLLGTSPDNVVIRESVAIDSLNPDRKLSVGEIAKIAYRIPTKLPEGEEPGIEEYAIYEPPSNMAIVSYAWHGAVVRLDTETGVVRVDKYVVVDDAGVVVNPKTAEGQIHGPVVSQAFLQSFSELRYDDKGNLLTTSFWQYPPPTAEDAPLEFRVEHVTSPSPTPGGFKGMGEGGAIGGPAALMNAVADALGEHGSSITKVPMDWREIWSLLKKV
ncbi:MAG: xanthine dehydrogenase family protein molybdopterin-binding subunit [Thermoprotei archaeon]